MRKIKVFLIFFLFISNLYSQWSSDPNENLEVNPWGVFPTACSDGEGGVFVGWKNFSYEHTRAYLQYIDKFGYKQWDEPLIILDKGDKQTQPYLIEDGEGGTIAAIVVSKIIGYLPDTHPIYDYITYLQRIDRNGNLLWKSDGVCAILPDSNQSMYPVIVTDKDNGVIICTKNYLETDGFHVRFIAQRISSSGQRLWGESGIVLMDSANTTINPLMVEDGYGGAIVYYGVDHPWYPETYFERIDRFGNSLWKKGAYSTDYRKIYFNNIDEMLIIGDNESKSNADKILYNFLTIDGNFLFSNDIALKANVINPYVFDIKYLKRNKSYIICWSEGPYQNQTILYQTIDSTKNFLLDSLGVPISNIGTPKAGQSIIVSDTGVVFFWIDGRDSQKRLFAQKHNFDGIIMWDADDVIITNRRCDSPVVISDVNDGAIAIWTDSEPWGKLKAQQVNADGQLGVVTKISDENTEVVNEFRLYQNYPNPFGKSSVSGNSVTTIRYKIPKTTTEGNLSSDFNVSLIIYDILGRKIAALVDKKQTAGNYEATFDLSDFGNGMSSGIYLITLTAGNYRQTIKSLLIK